MLKEQYNIQIISRAAEYIHQNTMRLVAAILISIAVTFAYGNVLSALISQWWSNNLYTHGFFIPLISLYLIWIKRNRLLKINAFPSYTWGFGILSIGIFMFIIGHVAGIITLQELSLLPTIAGIIALLLGTAFLTALWIPIVYLLFAIPIWENFFDYLYFPFQIFSAKMAAALTKFIGIPVYREGVYLQLPNITLEVAKGCSGISYLISVIAIGIPMAYIFLEGWLRRITLIFSAIVIAILSNGLRITMIAILSYYGISDILHGPYHILQGLFVAMVGYITIFMGLLILSKKSSKTFKPPDKIARTNSSILQNPTLKSSIFPTASIVMIFILLGSFIHLYNATPVYLKKNLASLPLYIDEWSGKDSLPVIDTYRSLGVDKELNRIYETQSGNAINLYIGYFEYQKQNKELIHNKTREFHADASKVKIDLPSYGEAEINRIFQKDKKRIIHFWYALNNRVVAGRFEAKLYLIWNFFLRRQTNGSVIMVITDIDRLENLFTRTVVAEDFIRKAYPELIKNLP